MNARTLRHDWPAGRAGLGLLGILLILGLGCGSNPPAAQEPEPEPEPGTAASEPANEPVNEPAPSTAPDSPGVAEDAPAAEPEQASVQQPAESEEAEGSAEPVAEPSGKLLQLIKDSENAGRRGLYGKAHKLCSQALEMEPGQPRAAMLCAISACNLGNKRLSRKYYAMLETEEQQKQIYQICTSKGIEVRE
jgi:hypothetical protein